jgi:hypothetical protein
VESIERLKKIMELPIDEAIELVDNNFDADVSAGLPE